MTRVAAVALTLVFAACASTTEPQPAPGGSEVILELNQVKQLDGTGITVALDSVEDSRCPTNVECFWEGNARVVLDLRDADGREITGVLNTHPSFGQSLTFRFLRIELTALDPQPSGTRPVVIYQAHLRWSYLPD